MKLGSIIKAILIGCFSGMGLAVLKSSALAGKDKHDLRLRDKVVDDLRVDFPNHESTLKVFSDLNSGRLFDPTNLLTIIRFHEVLDDPCAIALPERGLVQRKVWQICFI